MSRYRPYLDKTHPEVYLALAKTANASRTAAVEAGLPVSTIELVNMRVSQMNGCVTCLSIHGPAARTAGISQQQLDVLEGWRDSDLFSPQERAALHLAEALTRIDTSEDRTALGRRVSDCLDERQIAAVHWTVVLINAFNRVSIASGHPAIRPKSPDV